MLMVIGDGFTSGGGEPAAKPHAAAAVQAL
jgi:hypothetical protein